MVGHARSLCDDVEFSPEDGSRSDREFLVEVCGIAIEEGATTINVPDTVGYATPEEYAEMFRYLIASGSMAGQPMVDARAAALSLLEVLEDGDRHSMTSHRQSSRRVTS